ncbi:MAG: hypothetical protein L0271_26275, partial [Gemmatimonadetes bacterium]|nr:hypothetical protein [Gemmatimonadota bacterium]
EYYPHAALSARDAVRSWLRGKIRERCRAPRLRVGAKHPDGTLHGIRALGIDADGTLRSPQQQTAWDRPALSVLRWDDGAALRGCAGIHAAWPPASRHLPAEVVEMLDRHRGAIAEVAGYGQCVTGDLGWRAEHCLLLRVRVPAQMLGVVRSRYPEVHIEAFR